MNKEDVKTITDMVKYLGDLGCSNYAIRHRTVGNIRISAIGKEQFICDKDYNILTHICLPITCPITIEDIHDYMKDLEVIVK